MSDLVGALEIGGTHVSAGRVDRARSRLDPFGIRRFALDAAGSREELLGTIGRAALEVSLPEITRWGVAVPGPFDYERGVSKIRGVAKLDRLYGVDLRDRLSRDLALAPGRDPLPEGRAGVRPGRMVGGRREGARTRDGRNTRYGSRIGIPRGWSDRRLGP